MLPKSRNISSVSKNYSYQGNEVIERNSVEKLAGGEIPGYKYS
ncbi:MAG: hypothetical protein AB8U20_00475 [Rickettsiales endosymbiont of Dermacentor nuttalli]